ncbi:MAG: peptide ABC transporter substrate-binding protein [Eubacteriales bacterium]|nr:peptide ABC transporter substrate-binding protein [Eubacteriales bacterium]
MKKKLAAVLMSMVMAASGMTALAAETGDGSKVIRIGWRYEPETMDPANASADGAYTAVRLCVEPLLRNVNGEAQPGIAESYEASEDLLEYTFHLRESTYSDGTAVTANDIAYAVTRVLDPTVAYDNAYMVYFIEGAEEYNSGEGSVEDLGIEVIDDYTIKFTLCQTTYPLAFAQQEFAPMNEEFVESCGLQYGAEAEYTLTNGPFTLVSWVHDGTFELVKNENYWNADAINLDGITGVINAMNETAVDMMLAGELDVCSFTNANQVATLEATGEVYTSTYYSGFQFLHICHKGKTEETGKWLSNANFRRALSAAIDRDVMVQVVYTTDEAANRLELPSEIGVDGLVVDEYPYEGWSTAAEPEKAVEYLNAAMEELGCSDVSEIPVFSLLCYDSESNMIALNAIADMWLSTLGIRAEIDAQPIASMLDKAYSGDYDFWKGGQANGYIDWLGDTATEYLSTAGGPYFCTYPEYDEIYQKAANAPSWEERKEAMFELEQYYCENMLDLVITWSKDNVVAVNGLTGIGTAGYADYTFADITE